MPILVAGTPVAGAATPRGVERSLRLEIVIFAENILPLYTVSIFSVTVVTPTTRVKLLTEGGW